MIIDKEEVIKKLKEVIEDQNFRNMVFENMRKQHKSFKYTAEERKLSHEQLFMPFDIWFQKHTWQTKLIRYNEQHENTNSTRIIESLIIWIV